jgi:hypothetical protein
VEPSCFNCSYNGGDNAVAIVRLFAVVKFDRAEEREASAGFVKRNRQRQRGVVLPRRIAPGEKSEFMGIHHVTKDHFIRIKRLFFAMSSPPFSSDVGVPRLLFANSCQDSAGQKRNKKNCQQ